jgi:hypothetical protein
MQTLPSLDKLLADIRTRNRPRLYWGRPDTITVPVIKCRVCGTQRADDGTRCSAIIQHYGAMALCDTYAYPETQTRYEQWQAGQAAGLRIGDAHA